MSSAAASGAVARITNSAGNQVVVRMEIADTEPAREAGLSKRPSLAEDAGMLFVFPSDIQAAFWMKDTWIDLSIAFIAADGRIVDIQDMTRMTQDTHMPPRPYRYALEVNKGFYQNNGINPGDRVDLQLGGR